MAVQPWLLRLSFQAILARWVSPKLLPKNGWLPGLAANILPKAAAILPQKHQVVGLEALKLTNQAGEGMC